ncbi:hypothetical protein WA158_005007 [Blastocystis sp. Blastoise]
MRVCDDDDETSKVVIDYGNPEVTIDKCISKSKEVGDEMDSYLKETTIVPQYLKGTTLHDYQLTGFRWLYFLWKKSLGGILADEMGLGKTIQTLAALSTIRSETKYPFLIFCPLSLVCQWKDETEKYFTNLKCICMSGIQEERNKAKEKFQTQSYDLLIASYECILSETSFLSSILWSVIVIDEAQKFKNNQSKIYTTLYMSIKFISIYLLTGTPIQNNLSELYSLLYLCFPLYLPTPPVFMDFFSENKKLSKLSNSSSLSVILHLLLLRRENTQANLNLPPKQEVVFIVPLLKMQKDKYIDILTKQNSRNILSDLRKCCLHPYLFTGMEPEPFEEGDHLWKNSSKLVALHCLLNIYIPQKKKILIFSQSIQMLDILQDYCIYMGYICVRLDGSIRGDDRYSEINSFKEEDKQIFLLSTRAGGVGLNLVDANVCILYDIDWNPYNDLQAIFRCYRQGQNQNVYIYKLICKDTIDEYIYIKGRDKQILGKDILQLDDANEDIIKSASKFNLSSLYTSVQPSDDSIIQDISKHIYTRVEAVSHEDEKKEQNEENNRGNKDSIHENAEEDVITLNPDKGFYEYQGVHYDTKEAMDDAIYTHLSSEKRVSRSVDEISREKRDRARDERKRHMEEQEEEKKKRREQQQVMEEIKEKPNYILRNTYHDKEDDSNMFSISIHNVTGDLFNISTLYQQVSILQNSSPSPSPNIQSTSVIHSPYFQTSPSPSISTSISLSTPYKHIITISADNSGRWSKKGLFAGISSLSRFPEKIYEHTCKNHQITVGNVLLIPLYHPEIRSSIPLKNIYVAITIIYERNAQNELVISSHAVSESIQTLSASANRLNAIVHIPKGIVGRNYREWYLFEHNINRYMASQGIPCFVYYFPKRNQS